ncbi:hypothetical protein MTYP_00780 [Methylophilaceae bacterium]|nr:hypothetical protein MTYP_00780 [Methylophilaceae bacterium]
MSATAKSISRKEQPAGSSGLLPVIGIESKPAEDEAGRNTAIAMRAYYLAQERGFEPGHDLDDWLAAEQEECNEH